MKKLLAVTFILAVTSYLYFHEKSKEKESEWVTFQKNESHTDTISQHPTTKEEMKKAKIKTTLKKKRNIASLSPKTNKENKDLKFKNTPHKDWQKKMAKNVMRFLDLETKLFVQKMNEIIYKEKGTAIYAQNVHIKFVTSKGKHYSYNALVNQESGEIIKTWNKINHEGIGHERFKMSASSSN